MRHPLAIGKLLGTLVVISAASLAGAEEKGGDGPLAVGTYACWIGHAAAASGLTISGPTTYASGNKTGTYHLETGGAIVFENGPYAEYHAKQLNAHRIGMNLNGGSFYTLTCDPPK